jgi:hypothetical protein
VGPPLLASRSTFQGVGGGRTDLYARFFVFFFPFSLSSLAFYELVRYMTVSLLRILQYSVYQTRLAMVVTAVSSLLSLVVGYLPDGKDGSLQLTWT